MSQWNMLRAYSHTLSNSERLAWHGLHWWGLPLGMIFGAMTFWGAQAGNFSSEFPLWAWLFHFVLYFGGLAIVAKFRPKAQRQHEDRYDDAVQNLGKKGHFSDFFNTNP